MQDVPTNRPRTLDSLKPGEHAFVVEVDERDGLTRRLLEMGLTPGTQICAIRAAPLGDPIEIETRGYSLSMRRSEAQRVRISSAAVESTNTVSSQVSVPRGVTPTKAPRRIFLLGNPNCGKTTLFNLLTGAFAKTGNYAGVTVEVRRGALQGSAGIEVWDFPGTYSLQASSSDEAATAEALQAAQQGADILCCVVLDATTLARGLYLVERLLELNYPMLLVLTMNDEAKTRGIEIDVDALRKSYGVPVLCVNGRTADGIAPLKAHFGKASVEQEPSEEQRTKSLARVDELTDQEVAGVTATYQRIDARLKLVAKLSNTPHVTVSESIDRVLLHPFAGIAVFVLVMFALFSALFSWVTPLSDILEAAIGYLGTLVQTALGDGLLSDLLVHGVLQGAGNVVTFVPQIALLSFAIVMLEDSGYLARVAFVIDRVMRATGLHGKAFVPMLSGFACAVPAIMATRTLERRRDRLVTMLALPLMSCSARLPVYLLVVSTLLSGVRGAIALLAMYVLSAVTTVCAAALLRRFVLPGPTPPFVLELPPYRVPMLRNAVRETRVRVAGFLTDAGTTILALTIVLWALLTFPRHPNPDANAHVRAEYSFAGRGGKALEPFIEPLGFDWRIGVGLIGSFAAREVFVGTMGLIFGLEDDGAESQDEPTPALRERMRAATWPDGRRLLDLPTGLALMVFFVMAAQCMSTLAVLRRESGSWKWPVFALVYMNVLAWVAAFFTYKTTAWLIL